MVDFDTGACAVRSGLQDARLLDALRHQRSRLRETSRAGDGMDAFPAATVEWLRAGELLAAPLPRGEGGLGWGTEEGSLSALCQALIAIGYGNLAVGRVYEAHVNAQALIGRYGNPTVRAAAWNDVRNGHLFGLWIAQARDPVRITFSGARARVRGGKAFCTAAGVATRAVITALDERDRERLVLIDATRMSVTGPAPLLQGMRATSTLPLAFDMLVPEDHCFGEPDDYMREPDFSAGAWRTSAVTVGGLQALVDETIRQLRTRGRHTAPAQSARIGQMLIKCHEAASWVEHAAERADTVGIPAEDLTGFVNLARMAVEQACLDIIPLVQRSLGLSGFLVSNPVEALMRDIATYLRQPAGDEALSEAAVHFANTPVPSSLGFAR